MTDRLGWVTIEDYHAVPEEDIEKLRDVLDDVQKETDIRFVISDESLELLRKDELEALLEDALYSVRDA